MGLILVKPMAKGFTVHKASLIIFPPLSIIWKKLQKHWGVISKNEMLAHSEQTMDEH
jgi:hypothetical protein